MEIYGSAAELYAQKKKEKSDIMYFSICAASAVLGYIILSYAYAYGVRLLGLRKLVWGSEIANQSFSLVATMLAILIPFLFISKVEKKRTDCDLAPLGAPENKLLAFLAVPAGVAVCILASLIASLIIALFSFSDVTLTQPDLTAPPTGYALVIYVLRLTFSAALMEEFCIRGIVMQPLRKHGNVFAAVMSAMVFALMHCNLIQAPAAFISGIGIALFTIATGTMWTGICIHFINNAIVAVTQYLYASGNEDAGLFVGTTLTYIILAIGLVCLFLFLLIRKKRPLPGGRRSVLTTGERVKAYLLNPAMIIMIAAVAYVTSGYIE